MYNSGLLGIVESETVARRNVVRRRPEQRPRPHSQDDVRPGRASRGQQQPQGNQQPPVTARIREAGWEGAKWGLGTR